MMSITKFLNTSLRLKVNEEKSAVDQPWERKFLSFTFTSHERPLRRIALAALLRMKDKIRKLTNRKRGNTLEQIVKQLSSYLHGWIGYFGYCQTPRVLRKLEGWIRRKLRCLVWLRWKSGKTRYNRLRALGMSPHQVRDGAGNGAHGPWRMSKSPTLGYALSVAYFEQLGLPKLQCFDTA
jgi:RNA-directed DNA polymerase